MASRRRGVGSITSYSTKAGTRWRWQIRVPVDPEHPEAGTRLTGAGGFRTAREADDALQVARKKLREQLRFVGAVPTVADFAETWLEGLKLERSTIAGYRKIVRNHVAPRLGATRIDRLTASRLGSHYRFLEREGRRDGKHYGEPLSANSVNKVHIVIGAILDAAVDDGFVAVNVARKQRTVQAPTGKAIRAQRPEVVTWTAAELAAFLRWDREVFDDDLFALWHVIAHTGMRRSEALALRWGDVDMKHGRLSVRRAADTTTRGAVKSTKTGQGRAIDVDAGTVAVLRKYKAARGAIHLPHIQPDAYVFGNLAGEVRSPNEVGRRWTYRVAAAQSAGVDVPRLTLKGLRHTHATLLLELGEHPKVVQERLGHSTITTTMNIYSHVTPTMQRSAVTRFAAHLGKA